MADYGIFGHGSSGNGWFTSKLGDFHRWTKKWEPLGHYSVENPIKAEDWLVEKSSKALADAGIGEGWNRRLNREADENGDNFALSATRHGTGAAAVIGAMYGGSSLGGSSGSGAAAGGGGEAAAGNGAFLGEGVASGVPAWDGAAGGMGLGFNPNGMPQGSSYASDIPTNNSWWKGLMGNGGSSGSSSGNNGLLGSQDQKKLEEKFLGNPTLLLEALMRLIREEESKNGAA